MARPRATGSTEERRRSAVHGHSYAEASESGHTTGAPGSEQQAAVRLKQRDTGSGRAAGREWGAGERGGIFSVNEKGNELREREAGGARGGFGGGGRLPGLSDEAERSAGGRSGRRGAIAATAAGSVSRIAATAGDGVGRRVRSQRCRPEAGEGEKERGETAKHEKRRWAKRGRSANGYSRYGADWRRRGGGEETAGSTRATKRPRPSARACA